MVKQSKVPPMPRVKGASVSNPPTATELTRVKVETVVVDNEEPEILIVVNLEKY